MKMRPRIKRSKVGAKPKCHKENRSNLNEVTEDTLDLEIPDFSEKSENNEILTLEGIEKLLDKKFEVFEKRFMGTINIKSCSISDQILFIYLLGSTCFAGTKS